MFPSPLLSVPVFPAPRVAVPPPPDLLPRWEQRSGAARRAVRCGGNLAPRPEPPC